MALTAEMHNRGGRGLERDVVAIIERTCVGIGLRTGGSQSSGSPGGDRWEMTIKGPSGFGRSYTIEGTAGQREPHAIAAPGRKDRAGLGSLNHESLAEAVCFF
jgi:hypothetical protein